MTHAGRFALTAALLWAGIPASGVSAAGQITLNPTSLTVCNGNVTGKSFTASHGSFTQSVASANTAIATVSPPSGPSGSSFTVRGVADGSTQINVTDTQGATGTEPVAVDGPISASPATLTFSGTTATQNVTVTDAGPSVVVSASSSDPTVATVTASQTTSSNTATFVVTPVNGSKSGVTPTTTTLTFSDAAGCASKTVTVTVAPGALSVTPATLSFAGTGAPAQTLSASETDYTGSLGATSANPSIATVTPASASGPGPATFTVAPAGFGSTTIAVTDDHGGSKTVSVVVTGGAIAITGSTTAAFSASDNTSAHLAGSALHVTGSLQTTSTGSGQIAVLSPGNITGTHGGSLLIAYLTYTCTANGSGNDQGGTFAPGFLQLIASAQASSCLTFPANQFATLDLNVNLFLDDRAVPADSYTGSGFQIVLTAT